MVISGVDVIEAPAMAARSQFDDVTPKGAPAATHPRSRRREGDQVFVRDMDIKMSDALQHVKRD
jgi:hypothetical protein